VLGLAYLALDCCIEVSLHPEGLATGQLDQGFPWFSLVQEQIMRWYQNSKLHFMLHMQPSLWQHQIFRLNTPLPDVGLKFVRMERL
jgi:hypothetical protein